jgi:hypothetical protein
MKLNRSTLRRLIKEELTREVEEAQLDEIGGHGSAAGRAAADENFNAAVETLMQLMGATREAAVAAVASLRGGAPAGGHWTQDMNVGSPEAHVEGVETTEDPLAEGGASVSDWNVLPQGWAMYIMGKVGPEVWRRIGPGMDRGNYESLLADQGWSEKDVLAVSRIPESEEGDDDVVAETERVVTTSNATVKHSLAPAAGQANTGFSQMQVNGTIRPGSLLEVLEGRFENLSENMSLEDLDRLGDRLEAAGAPVDMISAIVDDIMNLEFGGFTAAKSGDSSSYSAAIADVPGAAKQIEQGQINDDLINQIAQAAAKIDADMPSSEEMAADLEGSHTPEEMAAAKAKVQADYPELYQGRGVQYPERYAEGFSNNRLGKLAGILED